MACKLSNKVIKSQTYDIPQPVVEGSLKLHFRLGVVGASGSGKTTSIVNFLKQSGYVNKEIFTNIVLISPSGTKNKVTGLRTEGKWEGIPTIEYEVFNKAVLAEIEKEQLNRILEYKNYLAKKEIFDRFMKDGDEVLTDGELMFLESNDFKKPQPPFGQTHYPTLLIIFDDCASSTQDKLLADFVSKSRHYNCSLICLVQHYAQMSRAMRKQLSSLILFKTLDESLLKLLWTQSCAADMNFKQFLSMFKSLDHRFEFIMMDFTSENCSRYRRNFDQYLKISQTL